MKIRNFIQDNFLIDHNETGALVPFTFRDVQSKYYDQLCTDYLEDNNFEGAREIDLKARKEGFTSFWLGIFEAITILSNDPVRFLEISYKDDATLQHYRRAQMYVLSYFARKEVGNDLNDIKKIIYDKSFRRKVFLSDTEGEEFVLAHNGASFYVGTASTRTGERGGTVKGVLFTESAHFPDSGGKISANEIIEGTQNMVAVGTGIIVHESTANGFNHFKTRWNQAELGQINYKPRFFSWRDFYTPEQFEIIKMGFSDKSKIPQEYPENPQEAFLHSGTPYFEKLAMKKYLDSALEPIQEGVIYA